MVAMALVSGIAQNRGNTTMARAMDAVVDIDTRVVAAVRWRGGTETAVNMIMGGAVTTDAVLAQQYDARVKEIIGDINKIQETIVAGRPPRGKKPPSTRWWPNASWCWKLWPRPGSSRARAMRWKPSALPTSSSPHGGALPQGARRIHRQLERRREAVREEAMAQRIRSGVISTLTALVVFAAGALLAWLLVRSITAPLQQAVDTANAIAAGDLTRELQTSRKDELGQMLRALNDMSARLRGVVSEVRQGVDSVSSASIQIANGNHDLSARTEQTAANLEETASSMEELTATVTQSADTARQANQLVGTAAQAAARGGEVVGQVVTSMQQITESSRKISDIIGVIDSIAFQTNILALNAAVEAARAGEQGRGFAVVASEVRSLARSNRSAEAAKEIKTLINQSVENVESGSAQVAQAGQSMEEIVASVRRVSDLIGEITASSTEQRDGISQVNQAVANLDQMTQQNAALVEESTAAASLHARPGAAPGRSGERVQRGRHQRPQRRSGPRPAAAPAPRFAPAPAKPAVAARPKPAPRRQAGPQRQARSPCTRACAKGSDDDWESF